METIKDYPPYLDYPKERKPQTNFDYFTDHPLALAQAFTKAASDGCPPFVSGACVKDRDGWDGCDQCWLDWLQQEAETALKEDL